VRYTVVWLPSAQDELALIWTQATDRQAVADAADEIDRFLRLYPLSGAQESGDNWRLVVEPLEVVYVVSPDDRLVQVIRVARVS
jgi:plasmid stabilization system protein ParE